MSLTLSQVKSGVLSITLSQVKSGDVLGGSDGQSAAGEGGGGVRLTGVVDDGRREVDASRHRQHLAVQDVEAVDADLQNGGGKSPSPCRQLNKSGSVPHLVPR